MTILDVCVGFDKAYLVTDAGLVTPQGLLVGLGHKVVALPEINAALATAGSVQALELLRGIVMGNPPESFDELAGTLEAKIRLATVAAIEHKVGFLGELLVVLAGWSERSDGPEAWCFYSHHRQEDPIFHRRQVAHFECPPSPLQINPDHAHRTARALVEAQRSAPVEAAEGGLSLRPASGFATLTTIGQDSITTQILVRWPDKVGEFVGINRLAAA